jgi:hypothetical protein
MFRNLLHLKLTKVFYVNPSTVHMIKIELQLMPHSSCNNKYKPITIVYMGTIVTQMKPSGWAKLTIPC